MAEIKYLCFGYGYFQLLSIALCRNTSCTKCYNNESFRDSGIGVHGILNCSDCNPFFMEWCWRNYFGWSIVGRRLPAYV